MGAMKARPVSTTDFPKIAERRGRLNSESSSMHLSVGHCSIMGTESGVCFWGNRRDRGRALMAFPWCNCSHARLARDPDSCSAHSLVEYVDAQRRACRQGWEEEEREEGSSPPMSLRSPGATTDPIDPGDRGEVFEVTDPGPILSQLRWLGNRGRFQVRKRLGVLEKGNPNEFLVPTGAKFIKKQTPPIAAVCPWLFLTRGSQAISVAGTGTLSLTSGEEIRSPSAQRTLYSHGTAVAGPRAASTIGWG